MLSLIRSVPLGLLLRALALAFALGSVACSDDLRAPPPFDLGPAPPADAAATDGGPG